MSDFAETVFGPVGTPLPDDAAELVNDADGAVVFEQARWLRGGLVVTVAGNLLRRGDAGHVQEGCRCAVCGGVWPCASRRLEVEASQLALELPAWAAA